MSSDDRLIPKNVNCVVFKTSLGPVYDNNGINLLLVLILAKKLRFESNVLSPLSLTRLV